jgi:hypothetical protein
MEGGGGGRGPWLTERSLCVVADFSIGVTSFDVYFSLLQPFLSCGLSCLVPRCAVDGRGRVRRWSAGRDRDNSNEKMSLRPEYGVSVCYDFGPEAINTSHGITHCRYAVRAHCAPVSG